MKRDSSASRCKGTICFAMVAWVTAALLSVAIVSGRAAAAVAYTPRSQAIDLGPSASIEGNAPVTVTVALKLRNAEAMQSRLEATYTKNSPQFHQFLSSEQFRAEFGPTSETLALVTQHFEAKGFTVTRKTATHLNIMGNITAMESEFGITLHTFAAAATGRIGSSHFRLPIGTLQLSPDITGIVQAVVGLDTRGRYQPQSVRSASRHLGMRQTNIASGAGIANPLGALTVLDFAQYYDVNPLYHHGLNGHGSTIGIVTLASFTPSDAFGYWRSLGLKVSPKRITEVQVDGGAGPPSDAAGSYETAIDVEESGGLAPAADIRVYEAPNTNQGFVDAFAAAIDSNLADTISCSWGAWEFYDTVTEGGGVTDPQTGALTSALRAYNDLFAQAALQGQSMYTVSADDGAFSSVYYFVPMSWPPPPSSVVVSAFDPAVQQWTTAMGGTTLPGTQNLPISGAQTITVTIATEQAWGWDYLIPWCTSQGYNPLTCPGGAIFSWGSGGGVSSYVPLPIYQFGIPGIQRTAPGQTLLDYTQSPPALVGTLPAGFLGRNVPDISLNSDPDTGYEIYYTSDVNGFSIQDFWGGTSFAAPQINGVTALYDQAYGRVGLLNFALYEMARRGVAYGGPDAPLRDITAGDNWYYYAHAGYDQATGLGVPDFWNLFKALQPQ